MGEVQSRIDGYARSMFRFEYLNDEWINRCSRYLALVFADRIKGRTVIDYAFGRGNWALAFLEAGAKKVIAIDAAESNVRKLSDHVRAKGVGGLEVIHGNIMDGPIHVSADILWVYGILHHIPEPELFLAGLSKLVGHDGAESLLYAYDANSLRRIIVETGRRGCVYRSYEEFADDSLLFNPAARMRARDDLTAPCVQFYSTARLWSMADMAGHTPIRFVQSFQESEGLSSPEFNPHHLHCGLSKRMEGESNAQAAPVKEEIIPIDLQIIKEFGDSVMAACDRAQSKKLSVGLYNTHFSALKSGGYERCLQEDYLYLLYVYLAQGLTAQTELQQMVMDISYKSLNGLPRRNTDPVLKKSEIIRHLTENRIRI